MILYTSMALATYCMGILQLASILSLCPPDANLQTLITRCYLTADLDLHLQSSASRHIPQPLFTRTARHQQYFQLTSICTLAAWTATSPGRASHRRSSLRPRPTSSSAPHLPQVSNCSIKCYTISSSKICLQATVTSLQAKSASRNLPGGIGMPCPAPNVDG